MCTNSKTKQPGCIKGKTTWWLMMHFYHQSISLSNSNTNSELNDNVYGATIAQCHCKSSPSSADNNSTRTRQPPTFGPSRLTLASDPPKMEAVVLHSPSPESWYSFYYPTEDRRLSRPGWLLKYRDGLPARRQSPIKVLTRRGVE